MFIRPVNVTVTAATRPPGHPLLRGLLRRAAGAAEWSQDVGEGEESASGAGGSADDSLADAFAEDEAEALAEAAGAAGMEGRAEAADEADAMARPSPWPTTPPRPPQPAPSAHATLVPELNQLADLAREGLLTPEEFSRAKARLLEG
ncbi:SHOCT domain-containing protein [Streptomyces sp. NPDC093801]|uniref:SHOCT domain-containing protein n=1 Tax=Streptomyces sp. NPDC093801 TaxID=3155203 RepID=UPI00344C002E